MAVQTTESPWWLLTYVGCCAGMIACGIWADGDPVWLTVVLGCIGTALGIFACWVAFKKLWQD